MSQRRLVPAVATVLVLAACGSGDVPSTGSAVPVTSTSPATTPIVTTPARPTTPVRPTTVPTEEDTVPTDSSPLDVALADLADRLDVDTAAIEVVIVEEVTWPDGGLGCPQPGMSYTQALVNGSRIVLAVDGTEYEYHSGRSGVPFYCPAERVTPPASGGSGDI